MQAHTFVHTHIILHIYAYIRRQIVTKLYRSDHLQSAEFLTLYKNCYAMHQHIHLVSLNAQISTPFCFRHTVPGQRQRKTVQSVLLIVQLSIDKVQNSASQKFNPYSRKIVLSRTCHF